MVQGTSIASKAGNCVPSILTVALVMETKASEQDMRWYCKFTEKVGRVGDAPKQVGDVPDEKAVRGFDAAEAMEAGEARCTALSVARPPPMEQRLVVERSPELRTSSLVNDAGETLLMSKATVDGCRFHIFVSQDGAPPLPKSYFGRATTPPEPAFALVASDSERNEWVLIALKCDRCASRGRRRCGMRHIARMRHYLEPVGAGQAFCMDVMFPTSSEGDSREVFCDLCGDASASWSSELSSRRPKWNLKHKSLSLDFRGRATMASAKNFQLESTSAVRKPLFLYGKVAEQKFVLDYCSPLGMVQAFAAALSVSHWV